MTIIDSRPRVLHICKVFLPERGGIQKVVQNIIALLTNYSHEVITTGRDGAIEQEEIDQATIYRCRSYGELASMPIAPSLVSKVLKQAKKAQLIAMHYPFPLAEVALLCLIKSPPIVVHWHSDVVAQKKLKWLVAPMTLLMLLRAKAIAVTSERMVKQSFFLRCFQHKIKFIPYGMVPVSPELITKSNEEGDNGIYFLMIARHVSYKGIDVAIKALQFSSARLIVAGDGPLFEKHKKLVRDLGLLDRISFKQHADDAEVSSLLLGSRALVVSSVMPNEAFALVQLEAMRLGKAVINTDLCTSVPWVARHMQEAVTIEPTNVQVLADAINQLNDDAQLATRLGVNGLQRYQSVFSSEKFSESMDDFYAAYCASLKCRH